HCRDTVKIAGRRRAGIGRGRIVEAAGRRCTPWGCREIDVGVRSRAGIVVEASEGPPAIAENYSVELPMQRSGVDRPGRQRKQKSARQELLHSGSKRQGESGVNMRFSLIAVRSGGRVTRNRGQTSWPASTKAN